MTAGPEGMGLDMDGAESAPAVSVPPARTTAIRSSIKCACRAFASIAVAPVVVAFRLHALAVGRNRALESASQWMSLVPGITGQYLRRAFLHFALTRCHSTSLVEFGTIFSQAGAILDENVYVGPRCGLGLVHLEKDVLLAAGVQVPSGGKTHYFDDPSRPIRDQGGERRLVTIGEGAWIGTGAIVLANVGKGTIVAAGSVVTRPLPDNVIAAGVPAKVIRSRFDPPDTAGEKPAGG